MSAMTSEALRAQGSGQGMYPRTQDALRPHAPSVHAIKQHLIDSRCSRDTRPAPWDSWTIAAAAAGGHVAVLEWMWSLPEIERRRCLAVACAFAAASGQLNGLMWLRDKGAPG